MFWHAFLALVISGALVFLLWLLRGALLTPVRLGKNESLRLTLRVCGPEPALENTVRALLWLMEEGVLPAELAIEDGGMDAETRRAAEILAENERVTLR